MKSIFLLSFSVLLFNAEVEAQQPITGINQQVYSIYEKQYNELLTSRGMPDEEIRNLLKTYAGNNINSDSALAKLLGQFFFISRSKILHNYLKCCIWRGFDQFSRQCYR